MALRTQEAIKMNFVLTEFLRERFWRFPLEMLRVQNEIWKYRTRPESEQTGCFAAKFPFGKVTFQFEGDVCYLFEDKESLDQ